MDYGMQVNSVAQCNRMIGSESAQGRVQLTGLTINGIIHMIRTIGGIAAAQVRYANGCLGTQFIIDTKNITYIVHPVVTRVGLLPGLFWIEYISLKPFQFMVAH